MEKHKELCGLCDGKGRISLHLASFITGDDIGRFPLPEDMICLSCGGTGYTTTLTPINSLTCKKKRRGIINRKRNRNGRA